MPVLREYAPIINCRTQQLLYICYIKLAAVCMLFIVYYRNIEEILAEKGERITKLKSNDIIELVAKDLTDGTKRD